MLRVGKNDWQNDTGFRLAYVPLARCEPWWACQSSRPHWVVSSCVSDCPERLDLVISRTLCVPDVPASPLIDGLARNCAITKSRSSRQVELKCGTTLAGRRHVELDARGNFSKILRIASVRQAHQGTHRSAP